VSVTRTYQCEEVEPMIDPRMRPVIRGHELLELIAKENEARPPNKRPHLNRDSSGINTQFGKRHIPEKRAIAVSGARRGSDGNPCYE
jgi:hypothetical protein